MSQQITSEQFSIAADALLQEGVAPSVEKLTNMLQADAGQLQCLLDEWWQQLPARMQLLDRDAPLIPDLPSTLAKSVQSLWLQAVQEAQSALSHDKQYQQLASEEARRHSETELKRAQNQQADMDMRYRELQQQMGEEKHHVQALDAEISVLKINLTTATSELKSEEQRRQNVEQELNLLQKTLDDSKRTFDQRVKDEQRHSLEQVAKAEADTRYFRNALEKLRDEGGRKESALTKDIHNLQALVAKKDVKLETLQNQIKALETELKRFKSEGSQSVRERSKLSGSLLSEQNRSKRLEDKAAELTEELKRANQKQISSANEAARRENTLRGQLKDKNEELLRANAKQVSLDKKMTAFEEEIRRLRSRLT
ncbi:MAG: DNA-binding protein [Amphritea sp.]|nr:DNA-binding protein [Amphritea sp.]